MHPPPFPLYQGGPTCKGYIFSGFRHCKRLLGILINEPEWYISDPLLCFEPRSHISGLSMIVRVNVVRNRTVLLLLILTDVSTNWAVVIFRVKVSCITPVDGIKLMVIDLIGQLSRYVIGSLSVKLWSYSLWRLVGLFCVSIRLLSQKNSHLVLVKSPVVQSFSRG